MRVEKNKKILFNGKTQTYSYGGKVVRKYCKTELPFDGEFLHMSVQKRIDNDHGNGPYSRNHERELFDSLGLKMDDYEQLIDPGNSSNWNTSSTDGVTVKVPATIIQEVADFAGNFSGKKFLVDVEGRKIITRLQLVGVVANPE